MPPGTGPFIIHVHAHTCVPKTVRRLAKRFELGIILWPFMLTSVRVSSTQTAKKKEQRGNECRVGQSWHLQMLHGCSPVNPNLAFVIVSKKNPKKTKLTHKYLRIHTWIHTWREIRVYALASQKSPRGTETWEMWEEWMDRWTVGEKTGWQNDKTVKDTLQYYVTAQQIHQGLREAWGRWENK